MKLEKIIDLVKSYAPSAFFFTPAVSQKSRSFLFLEPDEIISATGKDDFKVIFDKIDKNIKHGLIAWGMISYEIGHFLDKKLQNLINTKSSDKLLQFFFYEKSKVKEIKSSDIIIDDETIKALIKYDELLNFRLNTSKEQYVRNVNKIKDYILSGDTYQVNYSIKGKFIYKGDISSLFFNLLFNQTSNYTAIINNSNEYILSFSPELFFSVNKKNIYAKPMKGTMTRGINLNDDLLMKHALLSSKKETAENLMIVDLLRNDLGKISKYNSVKVKSLFDIEEYESLLQMTSSISANLKQEIKFSDIIKNVFPCGSVTGAPKIRTMEIIKELEQGTRSIYTGSIGIVTNTYSTFNVAIRTITINKKSFRGELGIGSGIVWDSDPEKEFREVLLKSNFLLKPQKYFELFESILIENNKPFLLKFHEKRLETSAKYFRFIFNKKKFLQFLDNILIRTDINKRYKLKILLNKWGSLRYEISILSGKMEVFDICISNKINDSQNKYLFFKTTNREDYESELDKYIAKGMGEVIFLNENKEITEGSFTNIFIRKGSLWLTPVLRCGLLPGVYRDYLLKNNNYKEEVLYLSDLREADEVILTNSVRKKIKVRNIFLKDEIFRSYF